MHLLVLNLIQISKNRLEDLTWEDYQQQLNGTLKGAFNDSKRHTTIYRTTKWMHY